MTTEEIITAKVSEDIADCGSGFTDVFNGIRVSTHTHYHLKIITVAIMKDGFRCKEFDRFIPEPIYTYIIDAVTTI